MTETSAYQNETIPVREAHRLDGEKLRAYLADNMDGIGDDIAFRLAEARGKRLAENRSAACGAWGLEATSGALLVQRISTKTGRGEAG